MKLGNIIARTTAALIALSMLAGTQSCGFIVYNDPNAPVTNPPADDTGTGEVTTPADTTGKPVQTVPAPDPGELARERLKSLPDKDLSAAAVIIAASDVDTICPVSVNDATSSARVDAKRAVEEKFNTQIITNVTDPAEMLNEAKEAYNSGMYYADLIAIPLSSLGSFYAAGILANMYSLPHVDYDADYYSQSINKEAIIGDSLGAVFGDACFNPDYLSGVYFNRTIAETCGYDLYQLVRDGKWTWDKLSELTIAATDSLNGIGGHASTLETVDFIDLAASSQMLDYAANDYQTVPAVNFMEDSDMAARAAGVVDKMYNLIYKSGAHEKAVGDDARSMFHDGSLLFLTERLYFMTWIPDSNTDWGILPLPKYDEAQSGYVTPLASDAPVFCALANTTDYLTSGLILEALNRASYGYVVDTYKNDRINYTLRDSASIEMLDIIIDGAATDFSHMYASGFNYYPNATYNAVTGAVTTKSTLDTLYKNYKTSVNRTLTTKVKLSG